MYNKIEEILYELICHPGVEYLDFSDINMLKILKEEILINKFNWKENVANAFINNILLNEINKKVKKK